MKRNRLIALSLSAALLLGTLTACGGGTAESKAPETQNPAPAESTAPATDGSYNVDNIETLTMKVNTSAKASTLELPGYGAGIKYFCDEVEKRSNGKVKLQLFLDASWAAPPTR